MSKIILVIASQGFQPLEYGIPKKILEKAGHIVITASDTIKEARAGDMSRANVDITIKNAIPVVADAFFIIGGPGALVYLDNPESYVIIKKWAESGKPFGAICISPRILAKAGVLKGKKATGWNDDGELNEIFEHAGATYIMESVVLDGNLITADGPASAEAFARTILQKI